MLPGIGSLSGGLSAPSSAAATSGDVKGGATYGGSGISSPIVIGGFKTDGSAAGGLNPIWIAAGLAALAVLYFIRKK